ncbi:hypothetical protein KBX50_05110 [Micromonospora sp. C51]|uniref:hypothetical protein n=1 Tax=Micromonospora sp. C51 TaxID=2824879 RepID=UPI001B39C7B1|nr:hypothetical protein [Micromonospora sp. C51]MBQ1047837.1 hypothetical protein [Micromonospora sp. C51]
MTGNPHEGAVTDGEPNSQAHRSERTTDAASDDDWLIYAANELKIDPWDCFYGDPAGPCVRPGHRLLPCQWNKPEDWPW